MSNGTAGFSLIEVLCAVLILGVSIVGLTQGLTTALSSNKEAEVQTAAALLAAGQIETLRAEGYLVQGELEGQGDGALSGYTWRQTITETKIEGLYEVSVVVQRDDTEVFELTTLLFDPPIIRETTNPARDKERRKT